MDVRRRGIVFLVLLTIGCSSMDARRIWSVLGRRSHPGRRDRGLDVGRGRGRGIPALARRQARGTFVDGCRRGDFAP